LSRAKAHTQYKTADGIRVPGVTTVLGILAKPALIPWANRLGLQGIDSSKYVDEKADIGTCAHYLIECELKGVKPDLGDFSPNAVSDAENGYLKWLEWTKGQDLKLIGSEIGVVSERYKYGGTVDVFATLNGINTLIDIKTSGSGIWPEMRHQVAAYAMALGETGLQQVDQVIIVRVGRSSEEGFQTEVVGNLDKHFELFLHALAIYRLQKELK